MSQFSTQPVVLAIDDEQHVLDEVAEVLLAAGYACHGCQTPDDALQFAAANSPDLILCDVNLGGHSGLELCERLKSDAALADTPVMFLSGAQIPDIIRRSHAAGGVYYLRKPFDAEVLVELVGKALWMPHLAENRARRRRVEHATV